MANLAIRIDSPIRCCCCHTKLPPFSFLAKDEKDDGHVSQLVNVRTHTHSLTDI